MLKRIVSTGALASLVGLAACGGTVEDAIDCGDICDEVDACLPEDIDMVECQAACQGEPESEIEECDACLDSEGMSCGDCLAACAPLAS